MQDSNDRVELEFQPYTLCFSTSSGFYQHDIHHIPPKLQQKGITQEQWNNWMEKYQKDVRPHSNQCWYCLACLLVVPAIVMYFFPTEREQDQFKNALKKWIKMVNDELPCGYSVKIYKEVISNHETKLMLCFLLNQQQDKKQPKELDNEIDWD
eukprot:TRINITY_DN40761_c0_g1_i4.p2 TRINITY_DN40761_c0_g1~~TRINITY_DN40761_c0_g1_i4.p2  ORF type:complete len:162 (-),score=0.27 TRINITY_DN40761_c0_g1_i4:250-708(-)